jgi:hypothetical protein
VTYKFGETFDVQPGTCWACGAELEAATAMKDDGTDTGLEGQPCICVVCTRVSIFELSPLFGLRVTKPDAATLAYLEADPGVAQLRRLVVTAQEQRTGRSMN